MWLQCLSYVHSQTVLPASCSSALPGTTNPPRAASSPEPSSAVAAAGRREPTPAGGPEPSSAAGSRRPRRAHPCTGSGAVVHRGRRRPRRAHPCRGPGTVVRRGRRRTRRAHPAVGPQRYRSADSVPRCISPLDGRTRRRSALAQRSGSPPCCHVGGTGMGGGGVTCAWRASVTVVSC